MLHSLHVYIKSSSYHLIHQEATSTSNPNHWLYHFMSLIHNEVVWVREKCASVNNILTGVHEILQCHCKEGHYGKVWRNQYWNQAYAKENRNGVCSSQHEGHRRGSTRGIWVWHLRSIAEEHVRCERVKLWAVMGPIKAYVLCPPDLQDILMPVKWLLEDGHWHSSFQVMHARWKREVYMLQRFFTCARMLWYGSKCRGETVPAGPSHTFLW